MIGHLQRNKVKYIIDKVNCIHSVESIRLAETIEKEAHVETYQVGLEEWEPSRTYDAFWCQL